ncbi:MAG: antibiotic biosynthesis monooxygenase [Bacteroidota bacterium]
MYIVIWQFTVKQEYLDDFVSAYGPNGTWAELFKKDGGYKETKLLQDVDNKLIFVTIDIWESKKSYNGFKNDFKEEYFKLDGEFEKFTVSEKPIAEFETGNNV